MKNVLRLVAVAMVAIMLCLTLASCGGPNADPDDAIEALKDNGISAAGKVPGATELYKLAGIDGVDCVVSAIGKIEGEYAFVKIIYFETKDDANDAWKKIQDDSEEDKKDADDDSDWVCKKSGKMIYYGTKDAIAAAK